MKMTLSNQLPEYPVFAEGIRRAPDRGYTLSPAQTCLLYTSLVRVERKPLQIRKKLLNNNC